MYVYFDMYIYVYIFLQYIQIYICYICNTQMKVYILLKLAFIVNIYIHKFIHTNINLFYSYI
jgi:hypothetical protein